MRKLVTVLALAGCTAMMPQWSVSTTSADAEATAYAQRAPSRDGTGKVYMGREISQIMGHLLPAGWRGRAASAKMAIVDERHGERGVGNVERVLGSTR